MAGDTPFVITVASEKGGVGKTTIATNLAVYLKALNEDLPVTIVSFDNHFSVDNMFAIGSHRGESVAGLFQGVPAGQLAVLGEYGVQFLASDRALTPPGNDPSWLRGALARSGLSGILILDTRPILDYFTQSALLAADLVLVPIKDRPSLVNTASLARTLRDAKQNLDKMWLLPSLIDGRLRLRENFGMKDFLVFAAEERGYQVLDFFIAKSPKVESLITNLSSRVYPVLTHARGTLVHRQLRELACFVHDHFRAAKLPRKRQQFGFDEEPLYRIQRLLTSCPACGEGMAGAVGQCFQDFRSRRRGFMHRNCLLDLLDDLGFDDDLPEQGMLALSTVPGEMSDDETAMRAHFYDSRGVPYYNQSFPEFLDSGFADCWRQISGRYAEAFRRDYLLIGLEDAQPEYFLSAPDYQSWNVLRRKVLRDLVERLA